MSGGRIVWHVRTCPLFSTTSDHTCSPDADTRHARMWNSCWNLRPVDEDAGADADAGVSAPPSPSVVAGGASASLESSSTSAGCATARGMGGMKTFTRFEVRAFVGVFPRSCTQGSFAHDWSLKRVPSMCQPTPTRLGRAAPTTLGRLSPRSCPGCVRLHPPKQQNRDKHRRRRRRRRRRQPALREPYPRKKLLVDFERTPALHAVAILNHGLTYRPFDHERERERQRERENATAWTPLALHPPTAANRRASPNP